MSCELLSRWLSWHRWEVIGLRCSLAVSFGGFGLAFTLQTLLIERTVYGVSDDGTQDELLYQERTS